MAPMNAAGAGSRSWTYEAVASSPAPQTIEDHFLTSLRRLTATLDVRGVCEAVLDGVERAFGATSACIMLHDRGSDMLRTVRFSGRGADVRIDTGAAPSGTAAPPVSAPTDRRTLADAERIAILEALRASEGRISGPGGAAAVLDLKPTTLHAKMKRLGIRRGDALNRQSPTNT